MHSSLVSLPLLVTVLSLYTTGVHSRTRPSVEKIASDYIVSRLFPSHSMLAKKLLNVLVRSVEDGYEKEFQQEEQLQYNDDAVDDDEDEDVIDDDSDVRISENTGANGLNVLDSDDDIPRSSSSGGGSNTMGPRDSLEEIVRRTSRQSNRSQRERQFGFGRRLRLAKKSGRGLGHCINRCMNGSGRMTFIQCKNMCH